MHTNFEVEKTAQGKALLAHFTKEDEALINQLMQRIESASLIAEQKAIIELTLLERLEEAKKSQDLKSFVGDVNAYADAAIAEISESIRQKQHISALTGGIALCAVILLFRSGFDLISGMISGKGLLDCMTALDLGHVIAIITILVIARVIVAGDKKSEYNDAKKARRRMELVGLGAIIAVVVLLVPYFGTIVILNTAALYVLIFSLVLLLLWKLSN